MFPVLFLSVLINLLNEIWPRSHSREQENVIVVPMPKQSTGEEFVSSPETESRPIEKDKTANSETFSFDEYCAITNGPCLAT